MTTLKKQKRVDNCKYHRTGHLLRQYPAYCKTCGKCERPNHFKVVCRLIWRQQAYYRPLRDSKVVHEVRTSDELQPMHEGQQDRSLDLLEIKYLNFDCIKSLTFTKLESSISQMRACITQKIDSGAHGNLMPFKIFKTLFPKSTIQALHAT